MSHCLHRVEAAGAGSTTWRPSCGREPRPRRRLDLDEVAFIGHGDSRVASALAAQHAASRGLACWSRASYRIALDLARGRVVRRGGRCSENERNALMRKEAHKNPFFRFMLWAAARSKPVDIGSILEDDVARFAVALNAVQRN